MSDDPRLQGQGDLMHMMVQATPAVYANPLEKERRCSKASLSLFPFAYLWSFWFSCSSAFCSSFDETTCAKLIKSAAVKFGIGYQFSSWAISASISVPLVWARVLESYIVQIKIGSSSNNGNPPFNNNSNNIWSIIAYRFESGESGI